MSPPPARSLAPAPAAPPATPPGPGREDPGAALQWIIDAATRHWEPLAAEAWAGFLAHGRGTLLLEEAELAALDAAGGDLDVVDARPTFMPVSIVHRGDDFRGLLLRSDPERQVMMLVRRASGDELLVQLDRAGDRPSPAECLAARTTSDGDETP